MHPDPEMAIYWPTGLRSAPGRPRLWQPLVALLCGLLIPAAVAYLLLSVAGRPSVADAEGPLLRQALLLVLYTLFAAPVPGWFLLPVTWPVLLVLARIGWAGLGSMVLAANLTGLSAAHLVLHGDVTRESPQVIPALIAAFSVQAVVVWAVFWALRHRELGVGKVSTP